jgi:hypothetical protein
MVNENNIPKTETVYELKNEIPSFEEFMKTYEYDERIINSYKDEVEYVNGWASKGSGPCYVCSKPETETYLKVACPVASCTDKDPKNWYHSWCFGSRMKISNRGNLRCEGCSISDKIGYWRFICSSHGGTPEYATSGAFRRALSVVLGSDDCDEVITDLGAYISDPKHKDEWFK